MQDEITPHKAKYLAYLETPEWREKRRAALQRAGNRCQLCSSNFKLQVHHRTYANLFREAPADLTVLCELCHKKHHGITSEKAAPQKRNGKPRQRAIKGTTLPVACPYCFAKAGAPCERPSGTVRGRVHDQRVRLANGTGTPGPKPKAKRWQGETLDFLASVPGVSGREVARRFRIPDAQAEGRLGYLYGVCKAIKIDGGWYALDNDDNVIRSSIAPGWRPKNAVY